MNILYYTGWVMFFTLSDNHHIVDGKAFMYGGMHHLKCVSRLLPLRASYIHMIHTVPTSK